MGCERSMCSMFYGDHQDVRCSFVVSSPRKAHLQELGMSRHWVGDEDRGEPPEWPKSSPTLDTNLPTLE